MRLQVGDTVQEGDLILANNRRWQPAINSIGMLLCFEEDAWLFKRPLTPKRQGRRRGA
jgi:hypothetical protein